jgi:drug/metabolite transporter (DMT)-like permease
MSVTRVRMVLLVVPAIWGLVFIGIHELLPYLDAFELVTLRFVIVTGVFGVLMVFRRELRPRFDRKGWAMILLMGLLAVPLSQLGIVYAQNFLHPTLASLIITTSPAAAAIMAPLFVDERISRRQAAGFALALIGAATVIIAGAGGASLRLADIGGAAIGLVTPVAWALYTIALKKQSADSPVSTVWIGLAVGTIYLVPWFPSAASAARTLPLQSWMWLLYLAIGGTFLAYVIWFWSLKYLDASQTSAYLYLVPVCALIWSLALLGEAPPAMALVGGVLVIIGVALTQTKSRATLLT